MFPISPCASGYAPVTKDDGVDAGDRGKHRMVCGEDDAALPESDQPRHDLWRHVVRPEAVDDDDQLSAKGRLLSAGRRQRQRDHGRDECFHQSAADGG